MPMDTVNVNLITSRLDITKVQYYNPLLVYKTTTLKIDDQVNNIKILPLNVNNYTKSIEALEKANGNDLEAEKAYLNTALGAFFGEDALRACTLLLYKDKPESIKEYLKASRHSFVVLINPYKKESPTDDGLSIYKDDYPKFKSPNTFFVFSTKETELKELFKDKGSTEGKGNIVIYSNGGDNLYLKFISQYLNQASIFHSVNPYGIKLKATPLLDDATIKKLRDARINFYALLNETGLDGVPSFKEGVDLAGTPIDELATLSYIKNETIVELIRVWNKHNRQNSKLSALSLSGIRENAYTASLECLFNRFKSSGLIVDYSSIRLKLKPSPQLQLDLNITITYNYSINAVVLNITTEDIKDYQNSLAQDRSA
ncbi:hypothetical protein CR532_05245 (plasmid) [Candidatus Borreliella tachyglossi]|uniref:Uncharacterized protein n=1 Tax=Candidatus Borreliella tachyglossi TaxID=1964448 RepID=A0A2S1LYQ2_9SPIR|nr:DUF787 family protein [Candidatus Borreliella tachyglossi]AWG43356.1 hypothetical protein CR532_04985 [Candidatus Borreliella tachyglossi]AWG43401.1 hypothetical protein CR532_05245 [Candidatus Borreliella tachyglossi]